MRAIYDLECALDGQPEVRQWDESNVYKEARELETCCVCTSVSCSMSEYLVLEHGVLGGKRVVLWFGNWD